ncbi:MAG TPA: hypothetical protein VF379_04975, partial [Gaiellaceae bacterium]
GLALSVICNVATVLATYVIGLNIGLRNRVALLGAALVALWPLVSLLAGSRGALNGTWQIDLGLSLYTEPLSTALVVTALALIVARAGDDRRAALAGALLGLGTLVRLSNVLILGCVLVALFVVRERKRAAVLALGAAAWAPATLFFWPKSYPKLKAPVFPAHPFEWSYAGHAWTDSTLWHPAVVLVLVPLALIGIKRAAPRAAVLLWSCVAVTALFYSFYELTPIHPRFLFVVLPIVLLFWAAGADVVVAAGRGLYDRGR